MGYPAGGAPGIRPGPAALANWTFLGGLLIIVLATESGLGSYDDVLFWDHMIQHLLLIMRSRAAPPSPR